MSRASGQYFETMATRYLQQQGLKLLSRNFHSHRGEIDLVMRDRKTLVFIEVKFRKNNHFGSAADSVTWKKQQHLIQAAQRYLQSNQMLNNLSCRFDVVAITGNAASGNSPKIDWIKNAFLIT